MGAEDVRPVLDRMAVGTWLGISLAEIRTADEHGMIDGAAGGTMIMTGKVAGMTCATLTAAGNSRGPQGAVGCGVMAGGTTLNVMNLTCTGVRRGHRAVTMGTVGGVRVGDAVLLHLGAVVMAVGVKIGGMTLSAGAAVAAVDGGIAVGAGNAGTIDIGMAEITAVVVDHRNGGACVTVHTQGRAGDGETVIMAVGGREEAGAVTADTL